MGRHARGNATDDREDSVVRCQVRGWRLSEKHPNAREPVRTHCGSNDQGFVCDGYCQSYSLVLIDGYHRVRAYLGFWRAYNNMSDGTYDWEDSIWKDTEDTFKNPFDPAFKVRVDVLYVGALHADTQVAVSLADALNHGNRSSSPMNLLDHLTALETLQ